jgi:hypothetical protein
MLRPQSPYLQARSPEYPVQFRWFRPPELARQLRPRHPGLNAHVVCVWLELSCKW